jgi:hypothetical protein
MVFPYHGSETHEIVLRRRTGREDDGNRFPRRKITAEAARRRGENQ